MCGLKLIIKSNQSNFSCLDIQILCKYCKATYNKDHSNLTPKNNNLIKSLIKKVGIHLKTVKSRNWNYYRPP